MFINEDKWHSIPEDLQKIIQEAALESQEEAASWTAGFDDAAEQVMVKAGVVINEVSPEERNRMKDACKAIYEKYEKMGLGELINRMLALNS